MKKIFAVLLMLTLCIVAIQCKKGEDDPLISLRSRKARVCGDWSLTSGTMSQSSRYGNIVSSTNMIMTQYAYSGTNTYVNGSFSQTTPYTGTYKYSITFDKDGSFSATEVYDGEVQITSGTWNFTDGVGDAKKREQIVLFFKSSTGISGSTTLSYSGNKVYMTFNIKELRNKKMVLTRTETETSGVDSYDIKWEATLEQ